MSREFLKTVLTTIFTVIFLLIFGYGLSWIITCGVVSLVCLCFNLDFSWYVATGIWIIMIFIRLSFKNAVKKR